MTLSGQQIKRVHQALLDAFTRDELRRLLKTELSFDFDSLVGVQGTVEQFFAIVEWADRTGRVAELLVAAISGNPSNSQLKNLINDALTWPNLAELIVSLYNGLPSADSKKPQLAEYLNYLRWVVDHNLYLDPRGTFQVQRQVQLKLEEIYISLQAVLEPTPGQADRRYGDYEGSSTSEVESSSSPNFLPDQQPLDLERVIRDNQAVVILGDPGSGKSTLLRYLALKNAQAILSENDVTVGQTIQKDNCRFPILIRIAEFAEDRAWARYSLTEYLPVLFQKHECGGNDLAVVLHAELLLGNCLILLDGLDEIVDTDARRGVVQSIEDFVARHRLGGVRGVNRIVITSRFAGYRNVTLGSVFKHYAILEMSLKQIQLFLRRWCRAVEDAQTPELSQTTRAENAEREIDGILAAVTTNPGVGRLAINPLMLRTLALIHRTGARLPQRRIELYKLAAETLVLTWRTAQGVPESALMDSIYVTRLLGELAYWLHANKPTGIGTEEEVFRILGAEWAAIKDIKWNEDDPNPDVVVETSKLLRAVREHTGLFVERAVHQYGFLHLTFEEYYAARHIVRRRNNVARLIRHHLHELRWEEPILLALGFIGLDYPDEASDLVETAIMVQGADAKELGLQPSLYEDLLARDYRFAIRCVGDLIPLRPSLVTQIMDRLRDELLNRKGLARFTAYYKSLEDLLTYLQRNTATTPLLRELLERELSNPESPMENVSRNILLGLREIPRDMELVYFGGHGDFQNKVLHLVSPPGIGKTWLLQNVLSKLTENTGFWNEVSPRLIDNLSFRGYHRVNAPSHDPSVSSSSLSEADLLYAASFKMDAISRSFWRFSTMVETRGRDASCIGADSAVKMVVELALEPSTMKRLHIISEMTKLQQASPVVRNALIRANESGPGRIQIAAHESLKSLRTSRQHSSNVKTREEEQQQNEFRHRQELGLPKLPPKLAFDEREFSRIFHKLKQIRTLVESGSPEPHVLDILFDSLKERNSEIVLSAADGLAQLTLRNPSIKSVVAQELASLLRRTEVVDIDTENAIYSAFWRIMYDL